MHWHSHTHVDSAQELHTEVWNDPLCVKIQSVKMLGLSRRLGWMIGQWGG